MLANNRAFAAHLAVAYAVAGEGQKGFEYLDQAVSDEDPELLPVIRYPGWSSLRSDPAMPASLSGLVCQTHWILGSSR